ncbi:unnamed protein product, partial [Cuscuta europaea]
MIIKPTDQEVLRTLLNNQTPRILNSKHILDIKDDSTLTTMQKKLVFDPILAEKAYSSEGESNKTLKPLQEWDEDWDDVSAKTLKPRVFCYFWMILNIYSLRQYDSIMS